MASQINWSTISGTDKQLLSDLNAVFIAAPREISDDRLLQLIKRYLPVGNIVLGMANEPYIAGFDGQPQFKTLQLSTDHKLIAKVSKSNSSHKITILKYKQVDISEIYKQIKFKRAILINGSWLYSFHLRPEYAVLKSSKLPLKFVSPFTDETEAIKYANNFHEPKLPEVGKLLTEAEMFETANKAAKLSFDTAFQTGVALGKKSGNKYKLIDTAYNKVVPYQTYAWHFGPLREKYLSQPGDLNHYDAVHAEIKLILQAQKLGYKTAGSTLFINLLPCPTCARALCEFDFDEVVYKHEHSKGYAVKLLKEAGKVVRRIKTEE